MQMQPDPRTRPVTCVTVPETRVALLEHRGDPARLGETIRRFIAWRKQVGLNPPHSATFNILYDDPVTTPPERFGWGLRGHGSQDRAE
jgi:AraC family transcriptional regulator